MNKSLWKLLTATLILTALYACADFPRGELQHFREEMRATEARMKQSESNAAQAEAVVRLQQQEVSRSAEATRGDVRAAESSTRLAGEYAQSARAAAEHLQGEFLELNGKLVEALRELAAQRKDAVDAEALQAMAATIGAAIADLKDTKTSVRIDRESVRLLSQALAPAQAVTSITVRLDETTIQQLSGRQRDDTSDERIKHKVGILNQPTATIIAAFIGFFCGTMLKYGLDRRLQRITREDDRRMLAAELHAEMGSIWRRIRQSQRKFQQDLTYAENDKQNQSVMIQDWEWAVRRMPAMAVFDAQVGKLGLLDAKDASGLIQLSGRVRQLDAILVEARDHYKANPKKHTPMDTIARFVLYCQALLDHITELSESLCGVAKVEPHNWATLEEKLFK